MIRSFKRKPSTIHERFGEETVIINLETGNYFSAVGIASDVWELVGDGVSEAAIVRRIKGEFVGDGDQIERDIGRFLDQLVEESLVVAEAAPNGADDIAIQPAGEPGKVFAVPFLQKYTDMEEMLLLDPVHEVDDQGWPTARRAPD